MMIPENKQFRGFLETPKQATIQSLAYIVAAFGFVAALAWNEAIKALIDKIVSSESDTIVSLFIYALVVTLLVVLASARLNKITEVFSKQEEE